MNLLVITQCVDADDEPMGFFVGWLESLSKKVDTLYVIAGAVGRYELPSNVVVMSMGREKGYGPLRRYFQFYSHFFKIITKTNGIFAHMSPTFPIISWPALLVRKPIVLWYAHIFSVTWRLRLSLKIVKKVLSMSEINFPISTPKLVPTGHGIDVSLFRPHSKEVFSNRGLNLISVNRMSRVKKLEVLIHAMSLLRDKFGVNNISLSLVGNPYLDSDKTYEKELRILVSELKIGDRVRFESGLPNKSLPKHYSSAEIVVSGQLLGGMNKSTLEGMACGCIPVVPLQSLPLMGDDDKLIMYDPCNPTDCARVIAQLAGMQTEKLKEISTHARETVLHSHNLENVTSIIVRECTL